MDIAGDEFEPLDKYGIVEVATLSLAEMQLETRFRPYIDWQGVLLDFFYSMMMPRSVFWRLTIILEIVKPF